MKCAACGAEYVPGDRFCGTCGDRLPAEGAPASGGASVAEAAAPAAAPAQVSVAAPQQAPPGAAACPVCGAALAPGALRCEICGFEPGSSVVIPGGSAIPRATSANDQSTRVCPIHGPLDPSWTRCPYCLREGREGRLPSGPI